MAAKKRNDPQTTGVSVAQDVSQAIAKAEAQAAEDTRAAFKVNIPDAWCVPVPCTLPGYEQIRVWFRTNNRFDVATRFKAMSEASEVPLEDRYRLWTLFIIRFEGWDMHDEWTGDAIPPPHTDDPASYAVLLNRYYDLLLWCNGVGYQLALSTMFDMRSGPN